MGLFSSAPCLPLLPQHWKPGHPDQHHLIFQQNGLLCTWTVGAKQSPAPKSYPAVLTEILVDLGDCTEGLEDRPGGAGNSRNRRRGREGKDKWANSRLCLPTQLFQHTACHVTSPETPYLFRLSLLSPGQHSNVAFVFSFPPSLTYIHFSPPPHFPRDYTPPRKH